MQNPIPHRPKTPSGGSGGRPGPPGSTLSIQAKEGVGEEIPALDALPLPSHSNQTKTHTNTHKKQQPLYPLIAAMTTIATIWMSYQFWRLLHQPIPENGAVDLLYRHLETTSFIQGIPVYWQLSDAVYPPASYLMLWPLIGWLPEPTVRPFWAITTLFCLALLAAQIFRIIQPQQLTYKITLSLLPLCLYATGAAIGNGQLVIHLLVCLLGSLIMLRDTSIGKREHNWQNISLISLLMLLALVKPNVTAPFFWLLLFKAPLSGILTATLYTLLTITAALFQPEFDGPIHLFKAWLNMGMAGVYYGSTPYVEYEGGGAIDTSVTAHSILGFLNTQQLDFIEFSGHNQLVSLTALALLGIWTYFNRHQDIWILASVAAIVSKYWTYHGWYDDLVLIVPLVTLWIYADWQTRTSPGRNQNTARFLFALTFLVLLAPGGAYLLPQPWNALYLVLQTVTLLGVLVFFILQRKSPTKQLLV